jgi:hypothetical protein
MTIHKDMEVLVIQMAGAALVVIEVAHDLRILELAIVTRFRRGIDVCGLDFGEVWSGRKLVLVCSCGQGVISGIVCVVIEEYMVLGGYLYHFVTAPIFAFVIPQVRSCAFRGIHVFYPCTPSICEWPACIDDRS